MSEEIKKMSAFEAFKQTQQTFAEAEEKAKSEAGAPKVERFRIGEDGEYPIRILPLAPCFDDAGNILPMDQKGYEYPIHQFFLTIKAPGKKGKTKKVNIPVVRATEKGIDFSVDLLDTYVRIAKEMYSDDKELIDKITGSSYEGGIRWNYQHAMMVLDVSSDKERAKGPQLWQCSHSQYKDIDAAKMRLWKELAEDGGQDSCPICGLTDAYPVKVIRKTEKKTEYTIEIGRKTLDIKEEEAEKLLELPRIPELIYRYTRYQMEATLAFLKQYDEEHDMAVCEEPDFKEAVKQLTGELPADDNSHFDLTGVANKEGGKDEVTIDSLWDEYNSIVDQDLSDKSDEYQELREKIRQFIEDKGLDVRISRTKNNQQLLDEIDEVLDSANNEPQKESVKETTATSVRSRGSRPKVEEEPEEDLEEEEDPLPEEEPEPESKTTESPRRRRSRPGSEPAPVADESNDDAADSQDEAPAAEPATRRRLHQRRLR